MDLSVLPFNQITPPTIYVTRSPAFPQLSSPVSCLNSTLSPNLTQLITCLEAYTVPSDFYDATTYASAQPTPSERAAWSSITHSLLELSTTPNAIDTCASLVLPDPLKDIYTVSLFTATDTSGTYCVLSETHSTDGVYDKGWGLVVVPATHSTLQRHLHISAPHPLYDGGTPAQAAAVFSAVGAKSLLIYGRHREAFLEETDCVQGKDYWKTDPAHDKNELFYDTNRAIWAWQLANGGCPSASCAFLQFHGKGPSTCPSDQIFLSTGLGGSTASKAWYTDSTPRPVKTLKTHLQQGFPALTVSLPSDSNCVLTATENVVGRFLNGIADEDVCGTQSNANLASGVFVHAEQAAVARAEGAYGGWVTAVEEAFEIIGS